MNSEKARQISNSYNQAKFADKIEEIELLITESASIGKYGIIAGTLDDFWHLKRYFEEQGFNCEWVGNGFFYNLVK